MIPYAKFLISFSAAAGFCLFAAGAQANDLQADQSAFARAKAQCAVFGPGFTAVEGSNDCVWIGRHVRVRFGSRIGSPSDNGLASGGPMHVNAGDAGENVGVANHLRLRDGYDETGSIAR
jgi:hypothetical protein